MVHTRRRVDGKLSVLALDERTFGHRSSVELRGNFAGDIAAGVVDGEVCLLLDGLGGDEGGQKGASDVDELHIGGGKSFSVDGYSRK